MGHKMGQEKIIPTSRRSQTFFGGQPRSHFAQEMEQEIISTSGVFARESV
jgi:hypothetical protein